ncbi:MAG: TetR/AcrR family transcriptional regulator [Chloroflexi bacterium]|nr:MAG: TetR/AcrR family transcriptional regulator [Chloroflexota bacterium]
MSSEYIDLQNWTQIHTHILHLEEQGLVTRTFRRLDPDRQQVILTAILDEAVDKGPESLNIKHVAKRAGVSVGSLYTYFPNRDGMLSFAVQVCARFVIDQFNQFRPYLKALPLREALEAYVAGGVEWSQLYTGFLRLFARAAYHGESELSESLVRPIATTMREIVTEIITVAADRGELRKEIDIEATIRIIHTLTIAVGDSHLLPYLNTYFQVVDDNISPERHLTALLDFIMQGIGNPHANGENK